MAFVSREPHPTPPPYPPSHSALISKTAVERGNCFSAASSSTTRRPRTAKKKNTTRHRPPSFFFPLAFFFYRVLRGDGADVNATETNATFLATLRRSLGPTGAHQRRSVAVPATTTAATTTAATTTTEATTATAKVPAAPAAVALPATVVVGVVGGQTRLSVPAAIVGPDAQHVHGIPPPPGACYRVFLSTEFFFPFGRCWWRPL